MRETKSGGPNSAGVTTLFRTVAPAHFEEINTTTKCTILCILYFANLTIYVTINGFSNKCLNAGTVWKMQYMQHIDFY